jgi:hypothetical protein
MEMAEGFGVSHCRNVEMAGGFAGVGRAIGIDAGFVFLGARRCVVPVGGTPISSWSRQVHGFSFLFGSAWRAEKSPKAVAVGVVVESSGLGVQNPNFRQLLRDRLCAQRGSGFLSELPNYSSQLVFFVNLFCDKSAC